MFEQVHDRVGAAAARLGLARAVADASRAEELTRIALLTFEQLGAADGIAHAHRQLAAMVDDEALRDEHLAAARAAALLTGR